jgi:SH3-like domain-containing protein
MNNFFKIPNLNKKEIALKITKSLPTNQPNLAYYTDRLNCLWRECKRSWCELHQTEAGFGHTTGFCG